MGLGISWKKAAIISAIVHLIALFIAVIFFVVVLAIQDMETYEIDLTQSVLDDGGSGHAGGNGTGVGTGNGDGQGQGNGNGNGNGNGDGHGTVKAAFDTEGFRARVQDNAQMPSMALKRKLQGDVTVQVTLDTNGNLIGKSIVTSTNEIFNDAAMSAVVAATPYQNPTGEDIDINVPVEFRGHESSDDEEE